MPETDCKTVPLGGMVRWRNAERCVSGTASISSNADSAGSRRREACSVTCTVQADVCRHLPLEGADLWWSLRAVDGKLLAIGRTQPDGSVLLEASLPAEHHLADEQRGHDADEVRDKARRNGVARLFDVYRAEVNGQYVECGFCRTVNG